MPAVPFSETALGNYNLHHPVAQPSFLGLLPVCDSLPNIHTGAGNVLRTFDRNRDLAPARINRLEPLEVFNTLRRELPHDEARRYLAKVIDAQKYFVNF